MGYFLLDEHLDRLARSLVRFGVNANLNALRKDLIAAASSWSKHSRKVRVEVPERGEIRIGSEIIEPSQSVSCVLAQEPVDSSDVFLRHKTSRREVYERALALHPHVQDVILWNEKGELTESCHANLVLEIQGHRLTPPTDCGLLPGTFRAYLLKTREIEEARLSVSQLFEADQVFLINSVRRWRIAVAFGSS